MKIPLTEPTAPRYIYVNPKTNTVHLLLPVVSGTDIGLDNTCKSVFAVQEFFGKSADVHQRAALDELMAYQGALEFDISLLDNAPELKQQKQERLTQIKEYIEALQEILKSDVLDDLGKALPGYPEPLQKIMTADNSNVHSMLLRPKIVHEPIRFVNPVFSIDRTNESVFYNALINALKRVKKIPGSKARIVSTVLASDAGRDMDFAGMQQLLQVEFKKQLNTDIDFTKTANGQVLDQAFIDNEMIYDDENPPSSEGYIEALLYHCTQDYFAGLVEPPFYSAKHVDELSIITQFYLAHINIYCRANNISATNFGVVLDASEELSTSLAEIVQSCIQNGTKVEDALLNFVNKNSDAFGLSSLLLPVEQALIKRQFIRHFTQIKETSHFDEFIILDATKKRPFFSYQNAISVHFTDFIRVGLPKLMESFIEKVKVDFEHLNEPIPPNNPWVHQTVEVSLDTLLNLIYTEEQLNNLLKKLPKRQQQEIMSSHIVQKLQAQKFLDLVAKGFQKEAEDLLKTMSPSELLLHTGSFTDYSDRTFNCTAYEYAYWAKDTHMRNMLERYMNDDTKAKILRRVELVEEQGLTYQQHDKEKKSNHCNLKPLIDALQAFVDGYDNWSENNNSDAMKEAWLKIGKAQRGVPVHVINEYCHPDRSFYPCPKFNEVQLPRKTTYCNFNTRRLEDQLYPLVVSDLEGLGVDFSLLRARDRWSAGGGGIGLTWHRPYVLVDLTAVRRLDEVRTSELKLSLETLKPMESRDQPSMLS